MKTLTVQGRRWFQKSAGNTYHNATVLIDGQEVLTTGEHYGYGEQYLETAFAVLEARGLITPRLKHANGSHEAYWQWAERVSVTLHYSATDVGRKKDL